MNHSRGNGYSLARSYFSMRDCSLFFLKVSSDSVFLII